MSAENRLTDLIELHLEGNMSSDEEAELRCLLERSPEAVDRLRGHLALDYHLREAAHPLRYHDALRLAVEEEIRAERQSAEFRGRVVDELRKITPAAPVSSRDGRISRFPLFGRIALAAASIALVAGLFVFLDRSGKQPGPAICTARNISGPVTCTDADGGTRRLTDGSVVHARQRLATAQGAYVQLKFPDGTIVHLNENTRVRISDFLLLETGDIYCVVTKRTAGQRPVAVRTGAGHRVAAVGTRFELSARGAKTTVQVEDGKVRLETSTMSREADTLQRLEANGDRISNPVNIMLYEIASWMFRDKPIFAQWTFENGPRDDLVVKSGDWRWEAGAGDLPGEMIVPAGANLHVIPKNVVMPRRPFMVTMKGKAGSGKMAMLAACATEKGAVPPYRYWKKDFRYPSRLRIRHVFIGNFIIHYLDDKLIIVREYQDVSTAGQLFFYFENVRVEEIELRSLRPEEMRQYDPRRAIEGMKEGPFEGRRTGRMIRGGIIRNRRPRE